MGEQKVHLLQDSSDMHNFVRHLLKDVRAMEYMLKNDWFESGITRIGAEQEMCLVDSKTFKPAPLAMESLKLMKEHKWVETELAKFNLETNMIPRVLKGKCLSSMEKENLKNIQEIRKCIAPLNADILLTGIMPTLRKFHLDMSYLTPKKRYYALMESINKQLIGNSYELRLQGIDELLVKHDSPLLEACNTSFQVHLQVSPHDFVKMYNIAQTIAAPVMAAAANSPIVFGRRLWHESRIALFQQALDTRTSHDHMRERSPRVNFGNGWLRGSIMDIYREDIARFRVLISSDVQEDAVKMIQEGKVPKLHALQVHNSTVYRWNRPCYGISGNGKPHIRIENRVLPSGPTVLDEISNAAFWLGLMVHMGNQYDDISKHISYADIRDNFGKAARYGMDSKFTWFKDRKIGVRELVKELLPMAREGLKSYKVNSDDIDRYMGVIEQRNKKQMNGARWQLRAFTKLLDETSKDEALVCLTAATIENQKKEIPVHKWPMPKLDDLKEYRPARLKVEEFMQTDIFTVQKDDIIELVAEMMDWRNIKNTPVEDAKGNLVGLVTSKNILKYLLHNVKINGKATLAKDVMIENPPTIDSNDTIVQAMEMMRTKKVDCLPVVKDDELVGIITVMDFLRISGRLMERIDKMK